MSASIFLNCPICNTVMLYDKDRGLTSCGSCGGRITALPEPERSMVEGEGPWDPAEAVARAALAPLVERYQEAVKMLQHTKRSLEAAHKPGNHPTAGDRQTCAICTLIGQLGGREW